MGSSDGYELIEKMNIEELEQRFEMGWGPKVKYVEGKYDGSTTWDNIDDKYKPY